MFIILILLGFQPKCFFYFPQENMVQDWKDTYRSWLSPFKRSRNLPSSENSDVCVQYLFFEICSLEYLGQSSPRAADTVLAEKCITLACSLYKKLQASLWEKLNLLIMKLIVANLLQWPYRIRMKQKNILHGGMVGRYFIRIWCFL